MALAGCSIGEATAEPTTTNVKYDIVVDNTGSEDYSIGSPATATLDPLGDVIELPLKVRNANGLNIYVVATVKFADGTRAVCREDDPRRSTSLERWTDTVDLPCQGLEAKTGGVVVTVTEEQ